MNTKIQRLLRLAVVVMMIYSHLSLNGQQEMFDDFYYMGINDKELAKFSWTMRNGGGGPGPANCSWSQNNISFVSEENGNKVMRLSAKTSGTGVTTSQSEVYTKREYFEGTYSARIRFTDAPVTGTPDGDQINETFFTISSLAFNLDPDYSENDFVEYLPNGGWGVSGPNLWVTTWETYQPSPWIQKSKSDHINKSFAGWHIVTAVVLNNEVKYYVDGNLIATHGGEYYPEKPMSINFNLWFIALINSSTQRTYVEDIDWVYHVKDMEVEPNDIPDIVNNFRAQNIVSITLTGEIRQEQVTSVSSIGNSETNIYPNPATDNIYVNTGNEYLSEISVYSLAGNLLFSKKSFTPITKISTKKFNDNGIVLIKIKTKDQNQIFKAIVK